MGRKVRSRLTYANAMATIAVFVALGGSSYAAVTLQKNTVKAKHIAKNAVRSGEVKDNSLLPKDFKGGQLPIGDQGPPGAQGPSGPQGQPGQRGEQGPQGAAGATNVVVRKGPFVLVYGDPDGHNTAETSVSCEPGERATGGGVFANSNSAVTTYRSTPSPDSGTPTGWVVAVRTTHTNPATGYTFAPYVVCALP